MHLVVCFKQILDPEIPSSDFKLDTQARGPAEGIASLVPSIFDEDDKAPIFQVAGLGVIEDYRAFIPRLIEAAKKRETSAATL
jgi:hypothetical protein